MNFKEIRIVNIFVVFFLPCILYFVLKYFKASDVVAMAIAMAIPIIFTITSFIYKRKLNPIGLISICGFMIAILIAYITNGNTLLMKIYHPIITGSFAVLCLFSVALDKPIIGVIIKKIKHPDFDKIDVERFNKNTTIITIVIGMVLLLHSILNIILAITLPTGEFLIASRTITIVLIVTLVIFRSFSVLK